MSKASPESMDQGAEWGPAAGEVGWDPEALDVVPIKALRREWIRHCCLLRQPARSIRPGMPHGRNHLSTATLRSRQISSIVDRLGNVPGMNLAFR